MNKILTCFFATHTGILTSCQSTAPSSTASTRQERSPTPPASLQEAIASVPCLSPGNLRRSVTRPVSYYALFQWWLLLSQHPGCLSNSTSLVTEFCLGTLAGGLGCFPFDREAYPSRTDSRSKHDGIRSLVQGGTRVWPSSDSVSLPPPCNVPRLALKLFRRERAISALD